MPIPTYRYVFMDSDIRSLEMSKSKDAIVWGIFLPFTMNVASKIFSTAIANSGGAQVWSTWAILTGLFQFWTIYYKYPKLKVVSSACAAVMWFYFCRSLWKVEWAIMLVPISACNLFDCLWILLHRTAEAEDDTKN